MLNIIIIILICPTTWELSMAFKLTWENYWLLLAWSWLALPWYRLILSWFGSKTFLWCSFVQTCIGIRRGQLFFESWQLPTGISLLWKLISNLLNSYTDLANFSRQSSAIIYRRSLDFKKLSQTTFPFYTQCVWYLVGQSSICGPVGVNNILCMLSNNSIKLILEKFNDMLHLLLLHPCCPLSSSAFPSNLILNHSTLYSLKCVMQASVVIMRLVACLNFPLSYWLRSWCSPRWH